MVMKAVFAISFIALLLLSPTLAVNGAFASKSQPQNDTHQDEINGPGGLMSLSGLPIQATNQNNPQQIKEHHPAHVKKFIGPSVSLSAGDAPATIWTAYGFNSLGCTHTTKTDWTDPSLCGHGQTIAIVDAFDDPNIASDLQIFDSQFGLPACPANSCFVKLEQGTPSTDPGWALEISLDVEWAHSIAPGAKIVLVESSDNSLGNLLTGVDTAVGQGAQQVSNSWGGSEFPTESNYDYHYNSPTASFFVSSGDGGHGVTWPAASPYVISVGGTTLATDSSGHWLSETAWSGSGGGISAYESKQSYQNNFNPNSKRAVPDVAYDANPNTGVYVYDSVPINGNSGWWIVGGTSAGAPQWAGISAITNSQNAKLASASFGTSNALYAAASGAQSNPQTNPYLTNYHDIITGSNGNCGSVCTAALGYDFVTGLGSPLTNKLIPYLQPSLTIPVGGGPYGVAYDSKKGEIFVANDYDGTVSIISDATNTVVATVTVGNSPLGIAYDSVKGEIFVTDAYGTVSIISDATNAVVATVTVGNTPEDIVYDSAKGEIFVSNGGDGTVSIIRDSDNVVVATVTVGSAPYGVVYDSKKGEIFVANNAGGTVSVIRDSDNAVVATIPVGLDPVDIAYDSANGKIFVANAGSSTTSIISDATNSVVATVTVGNTPTGIASNSANGQIFVANLDSNTTSIISATNNTVIRTIPVGANPLDVVYDSGTNKIFVANSGDGTVSLLP